MNFINYSLFHSELKTLKAHWHHFPSAGLMSKTLSSQLIHLHHHSSLFSLSACSQHLCCAQSTSLATSLSSQFLSVSSQTYSLLNHLSFSISSCKHSGCRQNQSSTVLSNNFNRVFNENEIIDDFIESRVTDLITDIIFYSDDRAEDELLKNWSQKQKKDVSAALKSFSSTITLWSASVSEQLSDTVLISLLTSEKHIYLLKLN